MTEKTITIIGAGLAGLSTGCYAQMNDYQSQIFEQHIHPGGLAACWKRKEFIIDGGIHFIAGHKPGVASHEVFQELGATNARFVDMTTYARYIDETTGKRIEITRDLNKLRNDLLALFPEDQKVIKEIISGAQAMEKTDISDIGLRKPPELMRLRDKVGEIWKLRGLWRYFTGKFNSPVKHYAERVHNVTFRDFLMNVFLPEVPVWFVMMILGLVAAGQMSILEDGSQEFVRAIEQRYIELGGNVSYQAGVEEILVEDDRAFGVRLGDDSTHRSDFVVSAADGYHTIYELLKGRYISKKIQERYSTWRLASPIVVVSFGVAQEFKEYPWLTILGLEKPITAASNEINGFAYRIFNYSSRFAPPGKTVVQVIFETDWRFWSELRKNKGSYVAEKEEVAAVVLNRLEKHHPGISSQIEVTDVATPYTYWRYTHNREGSIMGWVPTPEVMRARVEKTLPRLKNFYMAGQWAMPTGGVQPSLYSGRHGIQLICQHEGKHFKTICP